MVDELGLGAVEAMPRDGEVVDDTGWAGFMGSRGQEMIPWPAAGHNGAGQTGRRGRRGRRADGQTGQIGQSAGGGCWGR
jgi:hypothetical protein